MRVIELSIEDLSELRTITALTFFCFHVSLTNDSLYMPQKGKDMVVYEYSPSDDQNMNQNVQDFTKIVNKYTIPHTAQYGDMVFLDYPERNILFYSGEKGLWAIDKKLKQVVAYWRLKGEVKNLKITNSKDQLIIKTIHSDNGPLATSFFRINLTSKDKWKKL